MSQKQQHEIYKKIKLLGSGSYGKVEAQSNKQKHVIKQISLALMTQEEKDAIKKEAEILRWLDHPNIVKFKEFYTTVSQIFCIVMEYVDNGDLKAQLTQQMNQKSYLNETQIVDQFTQICLAVKHIHDRKIIHRDLKSENIFLTLEGMIKLGDFGVSKSLGHTKQKMVTKIGTPYYLAPEIINDKEYNNKCDIWSLGVILYEMCCLTYPFSGRDMSLLCLKIVSGQYKSPPNNYTKGMKDLIKMLLQVEPSARPSINQILQFPIIKNRIASFLSESKRANEFSHTVIHNLKFGQKEQNMLFDKKDKQKEKEEEKRKKEEEQHRIEQERQAILALKKLEEEENSRLLQIQSEVSRMQEQIKNLLQEKKLIQDRQLDRKKDQYHIQLSKNNCQSSKGSSKNNSSKNIQNNSQNSGQRPGTNQGTNRKNSREKPQNNSKLPALKDKKSNASIQTPSQYSNKASQNKSKIPQSQNSSYKNSNNNISKEVTNNTNEPSQLTRNNSKGKNSYIIKNSSNNHRMISNSSYQLDSLTKVDSANSQFIDQESFNGNLKIELPPPPLIAHHNSSLIKIYEATLKGIQEISSDGGSICVSGYQQTKKQEVVDDYDQLYEDEEDDFVESTEIVERDQLINNQQESLRNTIKFMKQDCSQNFLKEKLGKNYDKAYKLLKEKIENENDFDDNIIQQFLPDLDVAEQQQIVIALGNQIIKGK